MADTWDMSFLVNQATEIQEARGNLGRHFGMLQQVLIGRPLVNFVSAEDRLAFLRMMGKLSQRNWTELVAIRFRTPMGGERKVALQPRPGSGPTAWWLMMSENGADALPLIGEIETGDSMASEEEFGALAHGAASDAPGNLDLSVFRAGVLADHAPGRKLSQSKHDELDQKIGETLRETATGGIVTQPARGEYALVHDKDVPADQIAERITVTADSVGITAHELGLAHDSEPVPEDTAAQEVRQLIHSMREDLSQRPGNGARRRHKARTRAPGTPAGQPPAALEPRRPWLISALLGLIGRSPD